MFSYFKSCLEEIEFHPEKRGVHTITTLIIAKNSLDGKYVINIVGQYAEKGLKWLGDWLSSGVNKVGRYLGQKVEHTGQTEPVLRLLVNEMI